MFNASEFIGFLLGLVLLSFVVWFIYASIFLERATVKIQTACCSRCNYNLKGLATAGTCPECGTAYDTDWRTVRKYRVVAERIPIVTAMLFFSFLNFAALAILPYLTSLVAYLLVTGRSFSECSVLARSAAYIDPERFTILLLGQTWIFCIIGVRVPARLGALFVLYVTLGGIATVILFACFPSAWSQGMFVYFHNDRWPSAQYATGAFIGAALWCAIHSKTLIRHRLQPPPANAVQPPKPPPQHPTQP